jgi:hypothetical protein
MHTNLRPEPPFKQRFEFGALEVRGSSWASDWLHTVRGLNELAHTAGAPCAGAPASVPCRSKESKKGKKRQPLNAAGDRTPTRPFAKPPLADGRVVPLGSLRSPSFHNPPIGVSNEEQSTDEKSDMEDNI